MEHSSPLAAMQPPPLLFGHCFRPDVPGSFQSIGSVAGFGHKAFNFKELPGKKSHSDYFNMKPVQGSSPTASLAADLSQNFLIDESPKLATPRRSLFSARRFGSGSGREVAMTTPPLPSSSPALAVEVMDISPVPHNGPFVATTEVDFNSPSINSFVASTVNSPLAESPLDTMTDAPQESKSHSFLRPSLARVKVQSQWRIPTPTHDSPVPSFRLNNGISRKSLTTTPSLEEMFVESPPSEKGFLRCQTSSMSNSSRLRPPFGSNDNCIRASGSPGHSGIRKSSNPLARPRKHCRRSLSMFEHPEDVILENEATYTTAPLQSIADTEGLPVLQLPHFISDDPCDNLPRIDKGILVDLLDGKYNDCFENILIVDCRFEYEYQGGHIDGAVNYTDKEYLAAQLFETPRPHTALVLHCEYSAHRAPLMAKYIRHRDRAVNVDSYPNLTYPDMYILAGGYSAFFASYRSMCFPQNYVEMSAKEHEFACERGLGKVKQRSKLSRAQTFAFGQRSPHMEDSPTGRCRNNQSEQDNDSPLGDHPGSTRFPSRRMLSY